MPSDHYIEVGNACLTHTNLQRRGLIILVEPTFCEEDPEDRNLLFALQDYCTALGHSF